MQTVASSTWRTLSQQLESKDPPRGLDALWHQAAGIVGRKRHRTDHYLRKADQILSMEKDFLHISDRQLRNLIIPLRNRYRLRRDTEADHIRAFTIVREVAARAVGLRPYREQIAGALSLEAGCVAEMATGEGKTLVATMPAVLAGWRGRGCHVITANDYLAERDADLMRAVYRFCGLTVGCIKPGMDSAERKQVYNADITYCTNKEVAADFLRDRLLMGHLRGLSSVLLAKMTGHSGAQVDRLVLRGLECAIVDEADSVFIDDAVTPLLISGDAPNQEHIDAFEQAKRLADQLHPETDFRIDKRYREIQLTPSGKQSLATLAEPLGGIWSGWRRREELVMQALAAREFFIRGKQYVIDDDKVVIVDEFTGRLMPDRSWRGGLHQAVEAKEGLEINLPKETYARISFQRFFRLYRKLSGMSGTVAEAQPELWGIYQLPVVSIPTHRPCQRMLLPDRIFTTTAAKWDAVVDEIETVNQTGRPVLVGTGGIRESEYLSDRLKQKSLPHRVLNAVQQASEAQIIAEAGQMGQITVSTNMAGRGTDILLGKGVAEKGGLHVIATERFDARRIDRQLFGRCARQGDPGSAQAFISLEDELIQKHTRLLSIALKRIICYNNSEISSSYWRRLTNVIQSRAERASFRMRRDVLAADNWLDQHLGFAANDI